MLRRRGPALAIGLGAVLVLASISTYVLTQRLAQAGAAALPPDLAGIPLDEARYGAAATAEITHLHGRSFPLLAAAAGEYGGGLATLWVGETVAAWRAAQMIRAMEQSIGEGRSPFLPAGEQIVAGRTVHVLEGMGQSHFYFLSGRRVIWLAIDSPLAASGLQEVLRFYP